MTTFVGITTQNEEGKYYRVCGVYIQNLSRLILLTSADTLLKKHGVMSLVHGQGEEEGQNSVLYPLADQLNDGLGDGW